MLPVWMPDRLFDASDSIGNVLSALEINTALVAERVCVLKDYPFIGMMGYSAGETPFSYPELKYEKIRQLILEAASWWTLSFWTAAPMSSTFFYTHSD